MSGRTLYIANATYSSWSLRGWLACKLSAQPFDVVMLPFDSAAFAEAVASGRLPGGMVPVLEDDGAIVWESTAIIDHLAEAAPGAFWPEDRVARALARSAAAQMHAGFAALRQACPMNLRKRWRNYPIGDDVKADLHRLDALWARCRALAGDTGPYLFGAFGAADVMFAPVATRIDSYDLPVSPEARTYCDAVLAHPWLREWTAMAQTGTAIVAHDEVGVRAVEALW